MDVLTKRRIIIASIELLTSDTLVLAWMVWLLVSLARGARSFG